jgi:alkylmercury lyase
MTSQFGGAVQSWLDMSARHRGSDRFQLSYAAFRAILTGRAPHLTDLAAAIDRTESDAIALLHRMADEGRIRVDQASGTVFAAGGLSLQPSRHRLTMHSRTYWVWCALDVIGIPAGLGLDAVAESECLDTGEPVAITLKSGRIIGQAPGELHVSLAPADLHQSLCDGL